MQSQHIPLCACGPGKEVDIGREEVIGRCVISSVVVVPGGLGCTLDAVLENSRLCSQKGDN